MTEQAQTEIAPAQAMGAGDDQASRVAEEALVAEELLVEEISIDGMCGVY